MLGARIAVTAVLFGWWVASTYAAAPVFYAGYFDFGHGIVRRWEGDKLRQWLWTHWHQRSGGTATLKWSTTEGDSGTDDYTIAKDRDGVWYLSIHTQGSDRPHFDGDTAKWRDEWTIAYSVQRVEEPYQWDWPGKPISHSRPLPARKFVLELKDKEGKLLTHI